MKDILDDLWHKHPVRGDEVGMDVLDPYKARTRIEGLKKALESEKAKRVEAEAERDSQTEELNMLRTFFTDLEKTYLPLAEALRGGEEV